MERANGCAVVVGDTALTGERRGEASRAGEVGSTACGAGGGGGGIASASSAATVIGTGDVGAFIACTIGCWDAFGVPVTAGDSVCIAVAVAGDAVEAEPKLARLMAFVIDLAAENSEFFLSLPALSPLVDPGDAAGGGGTGDAGLTAPCAVVEAGTAVGDVANGTRLDCSSLDVADAFIPEYKTCAINAQFGKTQL